MTVPNQRPLRALVIGAGPASQHLHLPVLAGLRDQGRLVLALVCDIQTERASGARHRFGFLGACGDAVEAICARDVDVVYIFGSAQLHHEHGLLALRNGKHLFVEKPVAPTYTQAIELARVAKANGLLAVGGHNRRFFRSLAAIRARVGTARWRFAEATFHKPEFGRPPSFGARTWLGSNGIHALDALVFMMGGLPERLTAFAGTEPGRGAFSALMQWPDGAQGVFLCNNEAGSRREEYVFHGLGETCTVTSSGLRIEARGAVDEMPMPMIGDGVAAEHEAFLAAIRGDGPAPHSLEAIAPSLFLAELIETGFSGRVELPGPQSNGAPAAPRERKSILVSKPERLQAALARLLPDYRLVALEDVRWSQTARPDVTAAILGQGSDPLQAEILAKLPRLAIVGVAGLSLARYEPDALLGRGIALVNASAAYADSVAEFALALAILGRRRAFLSHETMRRGGWGVDPAATRFAGVLRRVARRARPVIKALGLETRLVSVWRRASGNKQGMHAASTRDLRGATVGLIGWGANARAFTERLLAAQARVLVYSEHAAPDEIQQSGAVAASLAEVLAADVVSLHRGLTSRTRHRLGAAELDKLCPGAVLINVARGALIEPGALVARLRRGDIFACLDTFEEEPPGAFHPLRRLPNVFLTSHIAGGSADMHEAAAEEVVRKVALLLSGERVETLGAQRLRTMT